jgi:hypothetical protein
VMTFAAFLARNCTEDQSHQMKRLQHARSFSCNLKQNMHWLRDVKPKIDGIIIVCFGAVD